MNIKIDRMVRNAKRYINKNSSSIAIGLSVGGFIAANCLSVKATFEAVDKIEEAKKVKKENGEEFTKKDAFKASWKCYVIPTMMVVGSTGLACFADRKKSAKYAALASFAKMSEDALTDRIQAEMDMFGKKKTNDIENKVAQKIIDRDEKRGYEKIVVPDDMDICFEPISGRYFVGNDNTIQAAVNVVNDQLNRYDSCDMNIFFEANNLDCTEGGSILGWNRKNGLISVKTTTTKTPDGRPCLVVVYLDKPHEGYEALI